MSYNQCKNSLANIGGRKEKNKTKYFNYIK
jgi:hypothetical protein